MQANFKDFSQGKKGLFRRLFHDKTLSTRLKSTASAMCSGRISGEPSMSAIVRATLEQAAAALGEKSWRKTAPSRISLASFPKGQ